MPSRHVEGACNTEVVLKLLSLCYYDDIPFCIIFSLNKEITSCRYNFQSAKANN